MKKCEVKDRKIIKQTYTRREATPIQRDRWLAHVNDEPNINFSHENDWKGKFLHWKFE